MRVDTWLKKIGACGEDQPRVEEAKEAFDLLLATARTAAKRYRNPCIDGDDIASDIVCTWIGGRWEYLASRPSVEIECLIAGAVRNQAIDRLRRERRIKFLLSGDFDEDRFGTVGPPGNVEHESVALREQDALHEVEDVVRNASLKWIGRRSVNAFCKVVIDGEPVEALVRNHLYKTPSAVYTAIHRVRKHLANVYGSRSLCSEEIQDKIERRGASAHACSHVSVPQAGEVG